MSDWKIAGAQKDEQSITAEWIPTSQDLIQGVEVKTVRNVPKLGGVLTELYRRDWDLGGSGVDQIFQSVLYKGAISAWHAHESTTDRLFAASGALLVVLYDADESSATTGMINRFILSAKCPALVVIPAGIWHGVQVISDDPAILVNIVDKAYQYESPDHWRLPEDTDKIPFSFKKNGIGGDAYS